MAGADGKRRSVAVLLACLTSAMLAGCDEADGRPFESGDGRTLTLLSLETETKETVSGRTVGILVATFADPKGLAAGERRPLAERLCPRVLSEMGRPEEVGGASLETVLIKYREPGTRFLGVSLGSSENYWVELSRGECVTSG